MKTLQQLSNMVVGESCCGSGGQPPKSSKTSPQSTTRWFWRQLGPMELRTQTVLIGQS